MSTAQIFNCILGEWIREITQLINEVKAGRVEAQTKVVEWMKFFMILSREIKNHPFDKKTAGNMQDIVDELKGDNFFFLEGREHFIERIGDVVHLLEVGDWVWARCDGHLQELLGRVEDVDHEHLQALVLFMEEDFPGNRGLQSPNACVLFPDILRIENDSGVIGTKSWVMEQYKQVV